MGDHVTAGVDLDGRLIGLAHHIIPAFIDYIIDFREPLLDHNTIDQPFQLDNLNLIPILSKLCIVVLAVATRYDVRHYTRELIHIHSPVTTHDVLDYLARSGLELEDVDEGVIQELVARVVYLHAVEQGVQLLRNRRR